MSIYNVLLVVLASTCAVNSQALQFSQSAYSVTLIEGVDTIPGSIVTTIGFNRELSDFERGTLKILPNSANMTINQTTWEVVVIKTITHTDTYLISVDGIPPVTLTFTVSSDPNLACDSQAHGRCSQVCTVSSSDPLGYNCSCLEGFTLMKDGRSCQANDPQPIIMLSHQTRITEVNTIQKSSTRIFSGNLNITLFDYNYNENYVYFLDSESVIQQSSLTDGLQTTATLILSSSTSVSGLAVDWISDNVIFSDSKSGRIQRYHVTNGLVTTIIEGLHEPKGVAVDSENRFVFWFNKTTEENYYTINRASLDNNDGNGIVTFPFQLEDPVAMAIDSTTETVYWGLENGVIGRCSFNGDNSDEIVYDNEEDITSIAIFGDYLYMCIADTKIVNRINKDDPESSPRVEYLFEFSDFEDIKILHPLSQPIPSNDINECLINNGGCGQGCVNTVGSYYCTCMDGYLLQADQYSCVNTSQCSVESLGCNQGCGLNTTTSTLVCLCNPGYKLSSDNKTCEDIDECSINTSSCDNGCNNTDGGYSCSCPAGLFLSSDYHSCIGCSTGVCSQTCVTLTDWFQCQCEVGYRLGSDDRTCFPITASSVIASLQRNTIAPNSVDELSLEGAVLSTYVSDQFTKDDVLTNTGVVIGMDVDVTGEYLYYGDRNNSGLYRVELDSNTWEKIVPNVIIWGVAYDWVNEYVYWTEDGSGKIMKVSVNGTTFSPESFLTGLDIPQGITVEPITGYVYWSTAGTNPGIFRATMNTPSEQTLVSGLQNPTSIAIDYFNNKLVWADRSSKAIQYSNLDGSDVQRLITTDNDQVPYQITVSGDKLYWTTSGHNVLSFIFHLYDNSSLVYQSLPGSIVDAVGITTVNGMKTTGNEGYFQCLLNSLGCSHTCSINTDGVAVCTCPDGYALLGDQTTCVNNSCELLQPCKNGGSCSEGPPGQFTCNCAIGFTGTNCTIDIDECDPNPCRNGGSCFEGPPGQFTCSCAPGFTGTNCTIDINECDPNPCQNGGSCSEGPPGQFTCNCAPGFTGTNCTIDINECDPNPCQNGGSCSEGRPGQFTCNCAPGFTGTNCTIDIDECDPNPCQNGGSCSQGRPGQFTCNCAPGFTGTNCETALDPCVPNPCVNGECIKRDSLTFNCDCFRGYQGRLCDEVECEDTFTGPNCDERECTESFCNGLDRGTCSLNIDDEPTCTCRDGFTGAQCETTISGRLSSEEKGGLSVGVIIGFVFMIIIIAASVLFVWKVVIPYVRRDKSRGEPAVWYRDTTLVRENPYVGSQEELLDSEYVAREFKDQGLSKPLDNPLYDYVPPKVNGKYDNQEDHTKINLDEESMSMDEWTGIGVTDQSPLRDPETVVINRYMDTTSPAHQDNELVKDDSQPNGAMV